MSLRDKVAGVDFSGARDAGKHIWIAEGEITMSGLHVETLTRADNLPGGAAAFAPALHGLVEYVASLDKTLVGFDFPFSLPRSLITQQDWPGFVRHFSTTYSEPAAFRDACRLATGGRELKRETDREAKVPWCTYNLRLYRQTWAGIRHVLWPLISDDRARVIPMQAPDDAKPLIAEICPASFLKKEDLYAPYKGRGEPLRKARSSILLELSKRELLRPLSRAMRRTVIDDIGGDALDAILSALCAARIEGPAPRNATDTIEARVYF